MLNMEKDVKKALSLLESEGYRCVLCRGDEVITLRERGVAPLLLLLDSCRDVSEFCAADKVVGRAAAFLYVLLGTKRVHALVMSEAASEVFERFDITYSYGELVPKILNRAGDGFCPMESAVLDVSEPKEAYRRVKETLSRMMEKNK